MPITYGSQTSVQASEIAFSIFTDVQAEFENVLYAEQEWPKVMNDDQIKTNINPGASQFAYIARDTQGAASFIGQGIQRNIPMVAQSAGAVTVPIAWAAVGATVTNQDAEQYKFGFNGNLSQDLGVGMRKACDNLVEATFFYGNTSMGFLPWMNYPGLTVMTAPNGAAGTSTWATKTPLEIFKDINGALTKAWKDSRGIFKPSVIFLPYDQYALISQPMSIGNLTGATSSQSGVTTSIAEYAKQYATVPNLIGRELEIIPIRYLDLANAAGTGARMVVMDRNPYNQVLPFPMPYTLTPPVPAPLAAEFYAEMKFGSFHVKQPGSMIYVDGI